MATISRLLKIIGLLKSHFISLYEYTYLIYKSLDESHICGCVASHKSHFISLYEYTYLIYISLDESNISGGVAIYISLDE